MEVGICNFKEDGHCLKTLAFSNKKLNACQFTFSSRYFSQLHTWLRDHFLGMKQGNVAYQVSH